MNRMEYSKDLCSGLVQVGQSARPVDAHLKIRASSKPGYAFAEEWTGPGMLVCIHVGYMDSIESTRN